MSTETIKQKFYGWRMIVGANLVDFFSAGLDGVLYIYKISLEKICEEHFTPKQLEKPMMIDSEDSKPLMKPSLNVHLSNPD